MYIQSHQHENNDDSEFRFNNTSTHEGHFCQNGKLIWFGIETAIIILRTEHEEQF